MHASGRDGSWGPEDDGIDDGVGGQYASLTELPCTFEVCPCVDTQGAHACMHYDSVRASEHYDGVSESDYDGVLEDVYASITTASENDYDDVRTCDHYGGVLKDYYDTVTVDSEWGGRESRTEYASITTG